MFEHLDDEACAYLNRDDALCEIVNKAIHHDNRVKTNVLVDIEQLNDAVRSLTHTLRHLKAFNNGENLNILPFREPTLGDTFDPEKSHLGIEAVENLLNNAKTLLQLFGKKRAFRPKHEMAFHYLSLKWPKTIPRTVSKRAATPSLFQLALATIARAGDENNMPVETYIDRSTQQYLRLQKKRRKNQGQIELRISDPSRDNEL